MRCQDCIALRNPSEPNFSSSILQIEKLGKKYYFLHLIFFLFGQKKEAAVGQLLQDVEECEKVAIEKDNL